MDDGMDDARLVERYLAGDTEAMGEIYDRHGSDVYRYLVSMIGDHDAEDVLQETFIKAGDKLGDYADAGNLRGWIFTIARNAALDRIRKRKRHGERPLPEDDAVMAPADGPRPEAAAEAGETAERIREALETLNPAQKEVFVLREEAGMSFKEISEMLDIPLNTALSHMHRAVGALRKTLADLEESLT